MLHLSTGLLQEYGIWQMLTAGGFLATGIVLLAKSAGGKLLSRFALGIGVLLCTDELMMLHECLDWARPAHVFLGLEFFAALAIGAGLVARGFFSRGQIFAAGILAGLSAAAYGMEFLSADQSWVRLEEGLELFCSLSGLALALSGRGQLDLKSLSRTAVRGASLVFVLSMGVFFLRPAVCPTVDFWSKKYFFDQIW